jgi:SAM-dependent methyltransferase
MTVTAASPATAVEAWDVRWATDEGRSDWLEAHADVVALLPELKSRNARRALDLGCGVGRHALLLAEHGLAVEAIDGSAAGVSFAREQARARGVSLNVQQGSVDVLPFPDRTFDFVLSWNVIYHGTLGDVGRRLAEIWRVLKPGALYQGTMLSMRNSNYRRGRAVAPDTFVDGTEEKAHPHFYCDAPGLIALFAGFELLSLTQQQQRKPHSWHWHIVAERRLG